jgi:hypothetical protein
MRLRFGQGFYHDCFCCKFHRDRSDINPFIGHFTANISGVLAARRAAWIDLEDIGYSVAVVTSLGGGYCKRFAIGMTPVFWLSNASYIFVPIVSMISMQIIAKGRTSLESYSSWPMHLHQRDKVARMVKGKNSSHISAAGAKSE